MKLIKRMKNGFGESQYKKALSVLDDDTTLFITPDGWAALPKNFKEPKHYQINIHDLQWKDVNRYGHIHGAYSVAVWYLMNPNIPPQPTIWVYDK